MNYKIVLQNLERGEIVTVRPTGNSMLPYIRSKQRVKLMPADWRTVGIGSIVLCKVRSRYYIHMVWAVEDKRGCKIGNAKERMNGWTKKIYGKVIDVLED